MAVACAAEIQRHESELGWWEYVSRQPDPRLRDVVRTYFGYAESTRAFTVRREVPSSDVTLIIGLGPALDIGYPDGAPERRVRRRSFVAGMHDTYTLVESPGEQHGLEVLLTPLGTRLLFGVPMHELANRVVELEDLLGREAEHLIARLEEAPGWDARFDILDAFFGRRLAEALPVSPAAAWAWHRLIETDGRVSVGALTEELRCSRRYLVSQFREHVGVPPKTVARILRFNRVIEHVVAGDGASWAEIAYDSGYYDQAHLNRDFREFAGSTPTEYVARRLPDGGGVRG